LDLLFFKSLPVKYKIAYRDYYTIQNLQSVRIGSVIFLLLNIIIRVLYLIFPLSLTKAENFPEFNASNWIFIFLSFIFYLFSHILISIYKKIKKGTAIMALFIFSFSLFIIGSGMFSSFMASSELRHELTLYLIAISVVGVLCIFEYYETIILIIGTECMYSALLFYDFTAPTEMVYNQLVSLILLVGFYLISRYFYSVKANYYMQLIEIKEKNTEIEVASEFKSRVLGMVAHDLRNPIAAVESVAMIMEMDIIDKDTQDNLNLIKASCAKARSIINDLLDAARTENTAEFITQKTELNKLLQNFVESRGLHNGHRNLIELKSYVNPVYAQINLERFQRVLDNLVDNAIKFSKSKVELLLLKSDSHVVIEVQDFGIGIQRDKLPIIFDSFTKAGRTGLKGEQSTGLGLSIVKQIVEKHKGKIEVESEVDKGSVFRISLPMA